MARNQTLANEAFLACGLERYRLAHGQYPDTLDALVPQFAEKLPHDIIGGQPLKYHRTADGQFVLYSVGWNEKDDGGVAGKTADGGRLGLAVSGVRPCLKGMRNPARGKAPGTADDTTQALKGRPKDA